MAGQGSGWEFLDPSTHTIRQRISLYREELARLKAENVALREQLARKLGAERAAAVIGSL